MYSSHVEMLTRVHIYHARCYRYIVIYNILMVMPVHGFLFLSLCKLRFKIVVLNCWVIRSTDVLVVNRYRIRETSGLSSYEINQ